MVGDTDKPEGEQQERQQERPTHPREERALPEDTVIHLIRAGTEFLAAMDAMMPHSRMPPDAQEHLNNIHKETLLLFRSFVDARLKEINRKKEPPAPTLRKIEVD
jgi:hypothetical protein